MPKISANPPYEGLIKEKTLWPIFVNGIIVVKKMASIEKASSHDEGFIAFVNKTFVLPEKINKISVKMLNINQWVWKNLAFPL